MPPKGKKAATPSAAAKKVAARTPKATAAVVAKEADAPAALKSEDLVAADEVEVKAKEVVEAKNEESKAEKVSAVESANHDENEVKEIYEEEDRGEHLELEDNEPEYEEEVMVDYDEKEVEHNSGQEGGDEGEEAGEEYVVEEVDMVDEEADGEDSGGEAEDENVEGGHDAEEEEHHDIVKERRKRKEFEVFVGGLDKDATEDDLKKVFTKVGEITEVRLMMNPHTKKNKGFAFLRFATIEQAKRAVSELKNPVVHGKQCGVAPSQDSDTLFLGNICKTWTKDHLKEKLKDYGIQNIDDLTLLEDNNEEGKNRGFAFLEFSSRSEAMDAFRRLHKRDIVFGVDRPAKVSFADSFVEPDDEVMAQVKTVFIDGILPSWDEDKVKECLKKFGVIEKVELARNMPAAKRKDFGFITFDTHDSAVKCVDNINSEMGEGDSKIKVKARLSRPLQRGRGRQTVRGEYRLGRVDSRGSHSIWAHPARRFVRPGPPSHVPALDSRVSRRPISFRDRRPPIQVSERHRRLPSPERPYERRPPAVPAYPKAISRRDYNRRDEPASRTRVPLDYAPRMPPVRRSSYREEYTSRGSAYADIPPRSNIRVGDRRPYPDDAYERKLERPPVPAYREERSRDYDSVSGSKRPYTALDDATRYSDVGARQSRVRLDYGVSGSGTRYDDVYGERLERSHVGYGGRSSLSGQDSHPLYNSRQGMSYGGGSGSGGNSGGMYPSNFGSNYMSRSSDVGGGSSYSSMYSGRGLGGSSYLDGNGSGSYY